MGHNSFRTAQYRFSFFFYVIDNQVSRMIKPIFALCVFIAAIQAYPSRQNQDCNGASCGLCGISTDNGVISYPAECCDCTCVLIPCYHAKICKAGQSPEKDTCGCRTCYVPKEVKTALEEEAQEELVEETENRSQ